MVSNIINTLVSGLNPREKSVVNGRFGLENGERQTLQSIGEKYGITRERVRQIESEALRRLREEAEKSELRSIAESRINSHLSSLGGVRKEDIFVHEIRNILGDKELHTWHLRFLSEIVGVIYFFESDDEFHPFWHVGENVIKTARKFQADFEKSIKEKKEDLIGKGNFLEYFNALISKFGINESVGLNYLSVSRRFALSPFGDFGLIDWEEINPRTVREQAYLALKKEDRPMHFRDVAEMINRFISLGEKQALPQTVHNELIKDGRVALVGRGMYALKSGGYVSGTTKDLIAALLEKKGPMSPKDIVDLVGKQRVLKENTIMLALQNRKNFKRMADGKISL